MSVLRKIRARELAQMQAAGWQVVTESAAARLRAAAIRLPAGEAPARRDAERVPAARRRWLR